MKGWDLWKKGFYAWEDATARHLETVMRNPLLLGPSGLALKVATKAKAAGDDVVAGWWSALGLPTRREQERALHLLNTLESRITDLEEKLDTVTRRSPPIGEDSAA